MSSTAFNAIRFYTLKLIKNCITPSTSLFIILAKMMHKFWTLDGIRDLKIFRAIALSMLSSYGINFPNKNRMIFDEYSDAFSGILGKSSLKTV